MKTVSFSLENANQYYATMDGTKFYVGERVTYQDRKGLQNIVGSGPERYQPADYTAVYGFWANFIWPTALAEGGLFHTLNTYDRARFTFGFVQFAAHVPNGDFVKYFRGLLAIDAAEEYFPDLSLQGGRICRLTENGVSPLESDSSTDGLLDYLNPSSAEVEDTEVIQAARFIHWVDTDPRNRELQVDVGVRLWRGRLQNYSSYLHLDGTDDVQCLLVADILHQGRAKPATIAAALSSADPLEALWSIGETRYPDRLRKLRQGIDALQASGVLGGMKYSDALKDFRHADDPTGRALVAENSLPASTVT